jgi:hypothetical protein
MTTIDATDAPWGDQFESQEYLAVARQYIDVIMEEWDIRQKEYPNEDDFIGVINTQSGRLVIAPRERYLASLETPLVKTPEIAKVFMPAGLAKPPMANRECMWMIVIAPGRGGLPFRFIRTRLVQGGSA